MKEITDIWFKTSLSLEDLTDKLGFDLEEYDYENVWEWTVATFDGVKLDICRDHTEKRSTTYTNIFRIDELDEHKKPFSADMINSILLKLKSIDITPIYLGRLWIGKGETFDFEIAKTIE